MFHKDSMDESYENEIEQLREELKMKNLMITELNINIKQNAATKITYNEHLEKENNKCDLKSN